MRYYGTIGYAETIEVSPGVWEEKITEKNYYGELLRNTRRLQGSGDVNDNITISNEISIISDPYINLNFHAIRYVTFMGSKWKVSSIDVNPPRLNLTMGGIYNE